MTASLRSLAAGFGLCTALIAASTAIAAPLTKAPIRPTKKLPTPVKPKTALTAGLSVRANVTARALFDRGVSMNVHRSPRVETTTNRVLMDEHTQLWLHFRAEKNTEYDISCSFSDRRSILTMDYASGKFVRQQTTTPAPNGRLHHKLYARPKTEPVKVYMQANGDVDWRSCTVEPSQ